ncbi:MAG: GTPase ObgE [Bacillota bacterium]|jgi:GTP-binding protein
MFIDQVRIYVRSGDGGNGMVHFRREKYVPRGGPAGGDGGRGGNVILRVNEHVNTLLDLRYRRHHRAEPGEKGGTNRRHGRDGQDLYIDVPPGTIVYDDDTDQPLADLTEPGETVIVARGGRGGRGNARFATSTQQAPGFAEQGEPGQERNLRLELKLLADVGLVGFPNAGKSTLLAQVSAARPKIADYPFTTLVPNLGVVAVGESSFVIADIPGLIEGAHQGLGLGHEFLRHIERTRVLVHLVDAAGLDGREPLDDFYTINRELAQYAIDLSDRPQIVALNKMDLSEALARRDALEQTLRAEGYQVLSISAATGENVRQLMQAVAQLLQVTPKPAPLEIPEVAAEPERPTEVSRDGDVFVVTGTWVERRVAMTNIDNEEALRRLQHSLRRNGVFDLLRDAGAAEGDTVRINDIEFDFVDNPM